MLARVPDGFGCAGIDRTCRLRPRGGIAFGSHVHASGRGDAAAAFAHADTGALDVYPCAHGEPATQHPYRYAATVSHAGDAAGAHDTTHDTTQSNAERHCRHAAANASRARTLW